MASRYFFDRQAAFLKTQDDYDNYVEQVISRTTHDIEFAIQNGQNLIEFFRNMLQNLAIERQNFAKRHDARDQEKFGQPRDTVMTTILVDRYREYNAKLILKIKKYLYDMQSSSLDMSSSYQFENHDAYNDQKTSIEVTRLEETSVWDGAEYSRLELGLLRYFIERELPVCSSHPSILVTVRYKRHDAEYPLTRYLTRISLPVEETDLDIPISTLIHTEPLFIPQILNEIAKLFKKAVEWDKQAPQELLNLIGQINYLFSHAMPFQRGSAAIGEWIEQSLFRYHGYDVAYHSDVNINMEALISSLNEFMEKYPSMLDLSTYHSNHLIEKKC